MVLSDKEFEYISYDLDGVNKMYSPTKENPDDKKYRYYHCVMQTFGDWKCEQKNHILGPVVNTGSNNSKENNKLTRLLVVSSYVPTALDPLVLKWKMIPGVKVSS